jgi:hypothetical protein
MRPYFRSSIVELESLFQNSKADPQVLQQLGEELRFRTTDRGRSLREQVTRALKTQNSLEAESDEAPQEKTSSQEVHVSTTDFGSTGLETMDHARPESAGEKIETNVAPETEIV